VLTEEMFCAVFSEVAGTLRGREEM
jgi:hypothetical protein